MSAVCLLLILKCQLFVCFWFKMSPVCLLIKMSAAVCLLIKNVSCLFTFENVCCWFIYESISCLFSFENVCCLFIIQLKNTVAPSVGNFRFLINSWFFLIGWSLPAFIPGQLWFILGFVLALFTPVTTVCTRTLISRCVSPDEVGSVFALISIISAIASSLITAAYQSIYKATLETFPSAFLLINASLLLVTIPTNLFLRKKLR